MRIRRIYIIVFSILLGACSRNRQLDIALEFAGDNRMELEKVLEHYKDSGEKYDAARFLIENMPHYFSSKIELLDSAKAYESSYRELNKIYDAKVIKAVYLIENIDLAFYVWKNKPWGRSLSFDDFCEFILPYRLPDGALENWRRVYYDRFSGVLDSLYQGTDPVVATDSICGFLKKTPWKYTPHHPVGICREASDFMVYVMRSLGLPVAIDMYLQSPVNRADHYWNVLQDTTGVNIPFGLVDVKVKRGGSDGRRKGKVYRFCYGMQKEELKGAFSGKEIPGFLKDPYRKDVTHEYFGENIAEIEVDSRLCGEYVYPGVFRKKGWLPVDVSEYRNGKAIVRNIEPKVIFIPLSNKDGCAKPVGYPFQMLASGIRSFRPDENRTERVTLRRKYPLRGNIEASLKSITGAYIEGASTPDFRRAELLHTITSVPYPYTDSYVVQLNPSRPYRYVRYSSAGNERIDVAELSFYAALDTDEKIRMEVNSASELQKEDMPYKMSNIDDGDYLTFYWTWMRGANIVFDLGRPQQIKKMVCMPHTDGNFIYKGEEYELYYQKGIQGWVSLGRKTAMGTELVYENVPVNALLWLTNLSHGNEEQVFYVENGEQVFILNDK